MPANDGLDQAMAGASPAEQRDTRVLLDALAERRARVGGAADLPADPALSERILAEARTRSAQISGAGQHTTGRFAPKAQPIPWWLWLAWLAAIAGAVVAWKML